MKNNRKNNMKKEKKKKNKAQMEPAVPWWLSGLSRHPKRHAVYNSILTCPRQTQV